MHLRATTHEQSTLGSPDWDMSGIEELRSHLDRTLDEVDNLAEDLHTFLGSTLGQLGRSQVTAVYVADRIARTYTAIETLFLEVSQYLGHDDPAGPSWHAQLLRRMKSPVSSNRECVISDDSFRLLDELRRFRHVARNNYKVVYNWTQLDDRCTDYRKLIPLVKRDLATFRVRIEHSPP